MKKARPYVMTLRLSHEERRLLHKLAKERGVSVASLIRISVHFFAKKEGFLPALKDVVSAPEKR